MYKLYYFISFISSLVRLYWICNLFSKLIFFQYPGKRSPSQNILNVFDLKSWIGILIRWIFHKSHELFHVLFNQYVFFHPHFFSLILVSLTALFIVKLNVMDSNNTVIFFQLKINHNLLSPCLPLLFINVYLYS